jgi:hypothetical protein
MAPRTKPAIKRLILSTASDDNQQRGEQRPTPGLARPSSDRLRRSITLQALVVRACRFLIKP